MRFTFPNKNYKSCTAIFMIIRIFLVMMAFISARSYASFNLESMGIILTEREERVSFNIKNTSRNPIILVTQLKDLDGKAFSKNILISPPITRIDPDKSQQINFVLKKGTSLTDEVLLKASFEGVEQTKSQSATLPLRQDIGFLIVPNSLAQTREPWKGLVVKQQNHTITISNPSRSVVRLGPQVSLNPSKKNMSLASLYILPGQTKSLESQLPVDSITIIPLSRYGLALPPVEIPVK